MNRRQFIAAIATVALIPKQFLQAKGFLSPNAFKVPNLANSTKIGKDVYFDLTIKAGRSKILPNVFTQTWGINQNFLGETIRIY